MRMRLGVAVLARGIIRVESGDKNDGSVALRYKSLLSFLFYSTVFIKENVTP